MQLRHVGIVCEELEKTLDFYVQWFGCSVSRVMHESGIFISTILAYDKVEVKTVKLIFPEGNAQIELLHFKTSEMNSSLVGLTSKGITHFAVTVKDLDGLYHSMLDAGVMFLSKPKISDDGVAKVCFCKDPNDVYIELVEIIE